MAAVLLSILGTATANAQEEVDITNRVGFTWNGEESFTFNDDGSITYNSKAWGGLGIWFGEEDLSSYASITYEFAEPTPAWGQVHVYQNGVDGSVTKGCDAGSTSFTYSFDGMDVSSIAQITFQPSAETTFQIKRIYLTTAVAYEPVGVSILNEDATWKFFPSATFAGFSEYAKVVLTVDIQGVDNFKGWGLGEITTPHVTKNTTTWAVEEGLMPLVISSVENGEKTFSILMKDLIPTLTSWPSQEGDPVEPGQYGAIFNMYGQGGGECTVTMKKIEVFEVKDLEGTDVEVNISDGDALDVAVAEATTLLGVKIGNVTVNLPQNGSVNVYNTIVVPNGLTINGEGSIINASELAGDVITLDRTAACVPKADGSDSGHKLIKTVKIADANILGLSGALIKDNQKTLLENLVIENTVVEMPNAGKNVIDFNGKGYVGNVAVKNSTIYATEKNTGFFAQYGSRPKNVNEELVQKFDVQNSTFANIAVGKNVCDLKQNGTDKNEYVLKNNIFATVGKKGQTVVGFNKGQTSATPKWEVSGNTFNYLDGEEMTDTGAAEVDKAGKKDDKDIVTGNVAGVAAFVEPTDGNFQLANCPQLHAKIGDPRWIDAELEALAADLEKEVATATALLGDTDPESFDEAYRLKIAITEAESLLQSLSINTTTYQETFDNLKAAEAKFIEATRPHYYIIGNAANGWSRTEIPEMVYNDKTQRYEYELTTTDKDYFAIVDKVLTPDEDAADADWSDFNTNHRYALAEGDQEAKIEEEMQLIKVNGTLVLNAAGTYYLSMDKDLKLTIIKAPEVEEITVAKALEIIAALEDGKKTDVEYKVKGFVVGDPDFQRKADETLYGNVNLNMADEKDGTTTLNVFRAKSYDNEAFTEETISLIKAGDEVVFQGKLQKYVKEGVTIPELVSGWLISVTSSVTGIKAISADVTDGAWYTIQGVRVAQPTKGVFIHNGKKVVIK